MAIQYFCGRPGSGKSYGVIENVLVPALKIGRLIYTNIPLNLKAIEQDYPTSYQNIVQFCNDDLTPVAGDYLMTIPGGAVIIIDECWRWWASGVKVTDVPLQDKEFFAEHRHKVGDGGLTQEIVLVSQSPSQIAKFLRDLIDQTVLAIKNNAIGSEKSYTVKIFSACIPSIDRPGDPQQTGRGFYKKQIYQYYQSHTKSETGLAGLEIKADKRLNIWSHWYIRYLAPTVLFASIWGVYTLYDIFFISKSMTGQKGSVVDKSVPRHDVEIPLVQPVLESSNVKTVSLQPIYSTRYRISGYIQYDGRLKIYMHDARAKHLVLANYQDCKLGDFDQIECLVGGEIVNNNTGYREPVDKKEGFQDVVKMPVLTKND